MASFGEIVKKLDAAVAALIVTAAGVFFASTASPIMIAVAAAGGVAFAMKYMKERRGELIVRRLKARSEDIFQLITELHEDEQLILAIFVERGKLTYAIVAHRDPVTHERFRAEGVLLSFDQVRARADEGKFVKAAA